MCCSHGKLKVILVIVSFFLKLSTSQTIYNYTSRERSYLYIYSF